MPKLFRDITIILSIFGIVLPNFILAQTENSFSLPENLQDIRKVGERAVNVLVQEIPGLIKKIWSQEVLPVWKKMYYWFRDNIGTKIESWFQKNIQPRMPGIKEDFQKEKKELKEEIKTELPKTGKSLWEKFKELIK